MFGWLRDLTRDGIEPNPGPVYCRGKNADGSGCNCSLKRDEVETDDYYLKNGKCDCEHKRTEHDNSEVSAGSGAAAASSSAGAGMYMQFVLHDGMMLHDASLTLFLYRSPSVCAHLADPLQVCAYFAQICAELHSYDFW